MKWIERFLVAFAVLGVVICLCNKREGILLVTFALPALAAFYLAGAYFLLRGDITSRTPGAITLLAISGAGFAYCLLSLLSFFLRWISLLDFLENTLIIISLLSLIAGIAYSRTRQVAYKNLLQRSLPMLGAFVLTGIICGLYFNKAR